MILRLVRKAPQRRNSCNGTPGDISALSPPIISREQIDTPAATPGDVLKGLE